MADPAPYVRGYSFGDYQTANPTVPLPGLRVDAELIGVAAAVTDLVKAVRDVRRSDGALKNSVVTPDSLSAAARSLLVGDVTLFGGWAPETSYPLKAVVGVNGATYIATLSHVAGASFADDLAAGKWLLIASPFNVSGTFFSQTFSGDGVTKSFVLSQAFGTIDGLNVYVQSGASGYQLLRSSGVSPQVVLSSTTQITLSSAPGVGTDNVLVLAADQASAAAAGAAETSANAAATSQAAASDSAGAAASAAEEAGAAASAAATSRTAASASAAEAAAYAQTAQAAAHIDPAVIGNGNAVVATGSDWTGKRWGTAASLDVDTDGTLAANSDAKIASQKATKTYVDTKVAGVSTPYASQAQMEAETATTAAVNPAVVKYSPRVAKAWAYLNQGTNTLLAAENVSSITHPSTGVTTIYFASPLSSANFTVVANSIVSGSSGFYCGTTDRGTSYCTIRCINAGGTATDVGTLDVAVFGDLP